MGHVILQGTVESITLACKLPRTVSGVTLK